MYLPATGKAGQCYYSPAGIRYGAIFATPSPLHRSHPRAANGGARYRSPQYPCPTIQTIQSREYVEKRTLPGEKRDYRELRLKADKITKSTKKETFGADKEQNSLPYRYWHCGYRLLGGEFEGVGLQFYQAEVMRN